MTGRDRLAERLADVDGEQVIAALADVAPGLARHGAYSPSSDVCRRPGPTLRGRERAAAAGLAASGHAQPPPTVHVHGALNVGGTPREIVEAIAQTAPCEAFPAALEPTFTAREVFAECRLPPVED